MRRVLVALACVVGALCWAAFALMVVVAAEVEFSVIARHLLAAG